VGELACGIGLKAIEVLPLDSMVVAPEAPSIGLIALLLHPRDPHTPCLLDIASMRTAVQPSPC
jgi:hypothetical protein